MSREEKQAEAIRSMTVRLIRTWVAGFRKDMNALDSILREALHRAEKDALRKSMKPAHICERLSHRPTNLRGDLLEVTEETGSSLPEFKDLNIPMPPVKPPKTLVTLRDVFAELRAGKPIETIQVMDCLHCELERRGLIDLPLLVNHRPEAVLDCPEAARRLADEYLKTFAECPFSTDVEHGLSGGTFREAMQRAVERHNAENALSFEQVQAMIDGYMSKVRVRKRRRGREMAGEDRGPMEEQKTTAELTIHERMRRAETAHSLVEKDQDEQDAVIRMNRGHIEALWFQVFGNPLPEAAPPLPSDDVPEKAE